MDNKPLEYCMQRGWVIFLFIFYAIIIMSGMTLLLYILIEKMGGELKLDAIRTYTFYASMLSSTMMTGVRYSQKLYKACIDGRVTFDNTNKSVLVGNVVYFLLRPVYSVTFSVIFVICLMGGLMFLGGGMDCAINERMVYLASIVSSFIGFSIGNMLDMFELVSKDRVGKIM